MNQRTLSRVARLAAIGVASIGLIGLAHRPEVRPAMRTLGTALGLTNSCPFGYDVIASPEQVARARRAFSASHAGSVPAPTRRQLGLEVGQSTRAEVAAWAATSGVACVPQRDPSQLTCTNLPETSPALVGAELLESTTWLEFDEREVLARLTTVRKASQVQVISSAFSEVVASLGSAGNAATRREGDPSAAFLSGGSLRQASAEYRFSNYFALIRATNVGQGYLLTEDYRAL